MWEDILKKPFSITERAKKLVGEVIDSTPRTVDEILDLMFTEIERKKAKGIRHWTGSHSIPPREKLSIYLNKNYNSQPPKHPSKKKTYWK